jgi:hypothetical protein
MVRLFAAAVLIITHFSILNAEEIPYTSDLKLPLPQIPNDLKGYADPAEVLASAEAILDVLKTAKFQKSSFSQKQVEPPCDALKRGMMLVHAGFNMLVNARERGWITPTGALSSFGEDGPYTGLVSERRWLLLRVWDLPRIGKLLELRERLRTWPQDIRSDLAVFLSEMLRFRSTRNEMLVRFHDRIKAIRQQSTIQYAWDYWLWRRVEGIPDSGDKLAEFHKRRPEPLSYEPYNKALFDLLNEIPGNTRPIDACFQQTDGVMVAFDASIAAYDPSYVLPAKYMFTFWERRQSEGLDNVTEYVIQRVIEALR